MSVGTGIRSLADTKSDWVVKQAEAFADQMANRETKPDIIIHDRDTKFTKEFTATLKHHGMRTNALPKASPNLNGRCERVIETIKLECLAKFIVFGKRHLDHLVAEFVDYYNRHHSHMERDHLPPVREEPVEIEVKEYAGGLVKSFERSVALPIHCFQLLHSPNTVRAWLAISKRNALSSEQLDYHRQFLARSFSRNVSWR